MAWSKTVLALALLAIATIAVASIEADLDITLDPKGEFAPPAIPPWASVYTLEANFRVPYFHTNVKVRVAHDLTNRRQHTSYYNGLDTLLELFGAGKAYTTFPRVTTMTCQTASLDSSDSYTEWLPNLQDTNTWKYIGYAHNHNEYVFKQMNKVQNFTNEYFFFMSSHNFNPIRLWMRGYDYVLGSHPDEYIIDYMGYKTEIDPTIFNVPSICKNARENSNVLHRFRMFHNIIGANRIGQPAIAGGHTDKFANFVKQHGKQYANIEEYHRRREIFEENLRYIDAHNARGDSTYTLGITRFADMELEEMQRVMIPQKFNPNKQVRMSAEDAEAAAKFQFVDTAQQMPASVDWYAAGKVNPPKDQGACGSCYTFGSAGALESAWAIKTGHLVSLSEQQMLDCAWINNGDSGCDGGYAEQVFQWIIENKGIALEQSYHYLMMDGFCRAHVKNSGVVIQSYTNVTATEAGLQAAVAKGPVAVAINAALQDFYFYTGGIYSNPSCNPNDRDHEVLVIGYGTQNNQDFWLLKNSWGDIWGEKGFFRFKRNTGTPGGQCGLAVEGRQPNV